MMICIYGQTPCIELDYSLLLNSCVKNTYKSVRVIKVYDMCVCDKSASRRFSTEHLESVGYEERLLLNI